MDEDKTKQHLLVLADIYNAEMKKGSLDDQRRQMYQHCIYALQRIFNRERDTTFKK